MISRRLVSAGWEVDVVGRDAATDRTMTDFVLEGAVVGAERVLADRRWFLISDEQWDEFQRLLEQPARELPRLRALLATPSPFADEASSLFKASFMADPVVAANAVRDHWDLRRNQPDPAPPHQHRARAGDSAPIRNPMGLNLRRALLRGGSLGTLVGERRARRGDLSGRARPPLTGQGSRCLDRLCVRAVTRIVPAADVALPCIPG